MRHYKPLPYQTQVIDGLSASASELADDGVLLIMADGAEAAPGLSPVDEQFPLEKKEEKKEDQPRKSDSKLSYVLTQSAGTSDDSPSQGKPTPEEPGITARTLALSDSLHCEASDEVTTESEMCTEESVEKMTSSTEGMVSLSEDSSGRDTYAQAATAMYSWPVAGHSDTIDLDDSDDQMNGLMGSYREISMDEDEDGDGTHDCTRDEEMHADTEEEVSNLSNDSNDENDATSTDLDENKRPNSLDLHSSRGSKGPNATDPSGKPSSNAAKASCSSDMEGMLSDLQGIVTKEGDMVSFVADNLQEKIKMSSPMAKKGETPPFPGSRSSTPSLYKQALTPQLPLVDPSVLTDMENIVRKIATSLDTMLENLTGTLHSMSSLTVDCMDTYKDAVCKTCDSMDANIKSMYQLMAKCEEMSNTMRPVYRLADQIKEIKRLLDLFENLMSSSS